MSRHTTLTPAVLRKIVIEEKKKLEKEGLLSSDTVDDAWAGGDNLVNKIDYVKALGLRESTLRRRANRITKARNILKIRLLKEL
jgi:hypothetical protein